MINVTNVIKALPPAAALPVPGDSDSPARVPADHSGGGPGEVHHHMSPPLVRHWNTIDRNLNNNLTALML